MHRARGRLATALPLVERARAGCQRALVPDHPYTLAAGMNRVICAVELGAPEGIEPAAEELVELATRRLGPRHPDTLLSAAKHALVAVSLRPGAAVEAALTAAVNDLGQSLGESHPWVVTLRAGQFLSRLLDPHDPY